MDAMDFINLICPEHGRTSCSDKDWSNGFGGGYDAPARCNRCALMNAAVSREWPEWAKVSVYWEHPQVDVVQRVKVQAQGPSPVRRLS